MIRKIFTAIAAVLTFAFAAGSPLAISRLEKPQHYVIPGPPRIRGAPEVILAVPDLKKPLSSANSLSPSGAFRYHSRQ